MSRRDDYETYLQSPEWRSLRERALLINGGFCSFCEERAVEVHHVRYPKEFKDDSIFNLQPVCRRHHEVMHGMGNVKLMRREDFELREFHGTKFAVGIGADNFVGTTFEQYCEAFRIPADVQTYFNEAFEVTAKELKTDNSRFDIELELMRKTAPDRPVLWAWEVARRAVAELVQLLKQQALDKNLLQHKRVERRECWEGIHRMELQIDSWVKSLMRGETVSARHPTHRPEGRLAAAMQLIAEEQQAQSARITEHDVSIKLLSDPLAPIRRLPDWATWPDALIAMGTNPDQCLPGTMVSIANRMGTIAGKYCRERGIEYRPKSVYIRTPAQRGDVTIPINQYPREVFIVLWPQVLVLLQHSAATR